VSGEPPARVNPSEAAPANPLDVTAPGEDERSFIRRHAYALFCTLLFVAMAGHTVNQKWASPDYWFQLAAVREFAHSLLHPGNTLLVGDASDPYLSPYTFILGAIVRATGIDAVDVLAVAGLANLVLLLFAIRRFVSSVSGAELAPLLTLVFTLTAWGFSTWRWSGFFSLTSLGTVLPLSSTFAAAVGLLTSAAVCAWLRGGGRGHLVVVGLGGPVVLLSHPMTAVWVGLVGLAFVISEANADNVRRVLMLVAVAVAAGLLALAWPFVSIWRTLEKSDTFDATNEGMYRSVAQRTVLALPGFVVLGARFLRRFRDPLALGAAFNLIVYLAGYATDHDAIGRVLPGIMLMAHVALAVWVAELIPRWKTLAANTRYAVSILVVAIVVVGAVSSASGAIRAVPRALLPARYEDDARLSSLVRPYDALAELIARDDVVVASPRLSIAVAASSGKVIGSPAPAPFVEDIALLRDVVAALLAPQLIPGEFRRLVREHHVEWFVVTPAEARLLAARVRSGDLRLEMSTPNLRVFRVLSPAPGNIG
jgi:hypothetical protein